MSLYTPASVLGTDNVAPVYNPDSRWQTWNMDEIYLGGVGAGKYIPKVKDLIAQIVGSTVTWFIVQAVNEVTLVPVLLQEDTSHETDPLTPLDILFGVGPGTQSDTYRAYLNKSVIPYSLAVDRRLEIRGSDSAYVKIFKGTDVGPNGVVISGIYNQNGEIVSENIPLELVATELLDNIAVKSIPPCNTVFDLPDAEVVTVVAYNQAGFVVSKRQLLIENSAFIRGLDASRKYVIGISLETPFLSATVNNEINYPLNVPLNAINLIGVVHYSDGSSSRMAVDGTRFSIAGLDQYAATIVGQKTRLVLKYRLGTNEAVYGSQGTPSGEQHVSAEYTIRTANSNGNYAVQLFAYPVWVDAATGYRLEWFLYDLDRSISYRVTPNVSINTNQGIFDPKAYGVKQTLSVSVNLREVNGTYKNFIHVQFLDIKLNKQGSGRPDFDFIPNWEVASQAGITPLYGKDVYATYYRQSANLFQVKLAGPALDLPTWLSKVYTPTNPQVDTYVESVPPTPTHFQVLTAAGMQEYNITAWNTTLVLNSGVVNNGTLFVKFIKRTVDTDLQLAAVGFPLYQVDNNGTYL